jgi:hypothetical protein
MKNHKFKLGDTLSIKLHYDCKTRKGFIVHIFKEGVMPAIEDVVKYGEFTGDIRDWSKNTLMGFRALQLAPKHDKIVIKMKSGHYFIMPYIYGASNAEWTLEMPSEKSNPKFCDQCGRKLRD